MRYIQFFKNDRGYLFRTYFVSLVYLRNEYSIQYKIKPVNDGVITVYQSERKPMIRNLYFLSLFIPIAYLVFFIIAIFSFCSYFFGRSLYTIGNIIKSIGCLFMFMPKTALDEFENSFDVTSGNIGEIF
jgi:hypothetical protein